MSDFTLRDDAQPTSHTSQGSSVFPIRTLVMAFRACLDNPGLSHLKILHHICKDRISNEITLAGARGLAWLSFRATMKFVTCLESYSLSVPELGLEPLAQGSCPHPTTVCSDLVGLGTEHLTCWPGHPRGWPVPGPVPPASSPSWPCLTQ